MMHARADNTPACAAQVQQSAPYGNIVLSKGTASLVSAAA
jgi:hypothetical protein